LVIPWKDRLGNAFSTRILPADRVVGGGGVVVVVKEGDGEIKVVVGIDTVGVGVVVTGVLVGGLMMVEVAGGVAVAVGENVVVVVDKGEQLEKVINAIVSIEIMDISRNIRILAPICRS
jgi:hypothetical protein